MNKQEQNKYNPFKEYPKIFLQSKITCTRFFHNRRDTFLSYSMSVEDLEQEVNLAILGTLEKFRGKPEEDLAKLCNKLIFWKLCMILRDVKLKVSREYAFKEKKDDSIYTFSPDFAFDGLKSKMNDRQYYIIYQIIVNDKKVTELAEELNVSRQWIYQLYRAGLSKAKLHMNL